MENLRVRVLDPGRLVNGDLVDDFLFSVGLRPDDPRVCALKRLEKVNESNGWRVVEALRALYADRHGLQQHHPLVRYLATHKKLYGKKVLEACAVKVAREMEWKEEKGLYFKKTQAKLCLDSYRHSILAMNEHLSEKLDIPLDLAERGFVDRPFLPDATRIPRSELEEFYSRVAETTASQREILQYSDRVWGAVGQRAAESAEAITVPA